MSGADVVQTAATLVLALPEPPSFNAMIALAKKRTRRTFAGMWLKQAAPIVYDNEKKAYELTCLLAMRNAGIAPPRLPWARWRIDSAEFRLHQRRDETELLAGLKWPVDALVSLGYVADDSPDELLSTPRPTQLVDKKHRGITLTISQELA